MPEKREITEFLAAVTRGDPAAQEKLYRLVHSELHARARRLRRAERVNNSLWTTGLVDDAFLRLVGQERVEWQNRAQFFCLASRIMRRILIDHARQRGRKKRGGGAAPVPLDDVVDALQAACKVPLVDLEEALDRLEEEHGRAASVVEMRFFEGLSMRDVGARLGISERTAKADWRLARAWLTVRLGGEARLGDA